MQIRVATEDDVIPLAKLYADAVRAVGPEAYSLAQIDRWAASADNVDRFRDFILRPVTFVAVDESGRLGFCGVEEDGHVASAYVRGDRQRQGIGTRLMEAVLDHVARSGIDRLFAEASEFSLPLFLKMGFQSVGTETVDREGVTFVRHLVEKRCQASHA